MFLLKYKNKNYHNIDDYFLECNLKNNEEIFCKIIKAGVLLKGFNFLKIFYKKIVNQLVWDCGFNFRNEFEKESGIDE